MKHKSFIKYVLLVATIFISVVSIKAQQLTVDETINYITSQTKKYYVKRNTSLPSSNKKDSISITISEYGFINIKTWIFSTGQKYLDPSEDPNKQYSYLFEDFTFDYRKVQPKIGRNNNTIEFYSYNSIQNNNTLSSSSSSDLGLTFDVQGIQKIKNAFDYLLEILKYNENFNKKDDDPFSQSNYNKKVFVENSKDSTFQRTSLKVKGNLFEIYVNVSGVAQDMIFDSGASDVTISSNTEKNLLDKGLISSTNYLTPSLYKLADGSIVKAKRLTLPYIKVGSFIVKEVVCCVNPSSDVQLLGKSFLNSFRKWSINNENNTLTLER